MTYLCFYKLPRGQFIVFAVTLKSVNRQPGMLSEARLKIFLEVQLTNILIFENVLIKSFSSILGENPSFFQSDENFRTFPIFPVQMGTLSLQKGAQQVD